MRDLALGRHADVVGELEMLVSRNPYRERLRGQLMLALYRSGRQAEALAAYRDTRRVLDEELGIEPGQELRELERRILAQDERLSAPRALSHEEAEATSGPRIRRRRRLFVLAVLFGLSLAAGIGTAAVGLGDRHRRESSPRRARLRSSIQHVIGLSTRFASQTGPHGSPCEAMQCGCCIPTSAL